MTQREIDEELCNQIIQLRDEIQELRRQRDVDRDEIAELKRLREIDRFMCDGRLGEHGLEIARLSEIVAVQPAINGLFPSAKEIDRLQVQIFHNDMSAMSVAKKRGGSTEWVVKFEYWHRGRRAKEAITIPMLQPKDFIEQIGKKQDAASAMARQCAAAMPTAETRCVAGIVRRRAMERGRGCYEASQVCAMSGHDIDIECVNLILMIGDESIQVTAFTEGLGTKANHAKWFGKWQRSKSGI